MKDIFNYKRKPLQKLLEKYELDADGYKHFLELKNIDLDDAIMFIIGYSPDIRHEKILFLHCLDEYEDIFRISRQRLMIYDLIDRFLLDEEEGFNQLDLIMFLYNYEYKFFGGLFEALEKESIILEYNKKYGKKLYTKFNDIYSAKTISKKLAEELITRQYPCYFYRNIKFRFNSKGSGFQETRFAQTDKFQQAIDSGILRIIKSEKRGHEDSIITPKRFVQFAYFNEIELHPYFWEIAGLRDSKQKDQTTALIKIIVAEFYAQDDDLISARKFWLSIINKFKSGAFRDVIESIKTNEKKQEVITWRVGYDGKSKGMPYKRFETLLSDIKQGLYINSMLSHPN